MLDQRGQLLRAAVAFSGCSMPSYDRALHALRTWLDSWAGIGHVAVEMHRQGFDLQLTQYDDKGWRAKFFQCNSSPATALLPSPDSGKWWVAPTHPLAAKWSTHESSTSVNLLPLWCGCGERMSGISVKRASAEEGKR